MAPKVDYQRALQDVATTMVRLKRPERLLKMITRFIDRRMGLSHTSILVRDEEKRSGFSFVDSKGSRRLPVGLIRMDVDHPIVRFFQKVRRRSLFKEDYLYRPMIRRLLRKSQDSLPVTMSTELRQILRTMEDFKVELVVPGYHKDSLIGLLLLGTRHNRRPFSHVQISFFQTLVQDCAMAVKAAEYNRHLVQHNKELQQKLEEIETLRRKERERYYEVMRSLAQEVLAKDPYTYGHVSQVERLGMLTAREMGINLTGRAKDVLTASLILHDVGKVGIPDSILKKTDKLDEEEWVIMKTHVEKGAKILEQLSDFREVAEIVRCHHEYYDGTGYPRGIRGEAIPIESRVISVVDAFHAIVSTRCYSRGRSIETAIEELEKNAGTQFDPKVVECFIRALKREMKKRGVGFLMDETAA